MTATFRRTPLRRLVVPYGERESVKSARAPLDDFAAEAARHPVFRLLEHDSPS